MLSRTADHLFWMSRYTERAENTARLLDVNWQMSLLPSASNDGADPSEAGWLSMLKISELETAYFEKHSQISATAVLDFMTRDATNPSSIYCCLQQARENARAVRGSLTTESWETINTTWLELQKQLQFEALERDPSQFFEWVKFRSHLARGVLVGTMLQDDAMHFIGLGTFLERADNTARILDHRYHDGDNPVQHTSDAPRDFYHWTAVLRSVSGFEIYRKVYRDVVTPERVAELLILRRDMPRSLLASMNEVCEHLEQVRNQRSDETMRLAGKLRAELQYGRIDDMLEEDGLHAYLKRFMERVGALGVQISQDFLVPLAVA
jgi:uncharacterized alpha-E superfamily protein